MKNTRSIQGYVAYSGQLMVRKTPLISYRLLTHVPIIEVTFEITQTRELDQVIAEN